MNSTRRRFLGSSAIFLGSTLLDALATPLWKWKRNAQLEAATVSNSAATSPVTFVDVAKEAGLNSPNVWGATSSKPKAAASRFSITIKTAGSIFI
jgi:enediyne biosynthesis protein E4